MPFDLPGCYKLLTGHYEDCLERQTACLKEKMDGHLLHTKRVLTICSEIAEALPPEGRSLVNRELLSSAAVLHDIAKFDDRDDHHKIAEKEIAGHIDCLNWEADGFAMKTLGSVIRAHKGSFEPEEDCACEAAILRMADKIDMLRWDGDKKKEYKRGLEKIEEYFKGHFPSGSPKALFLDDFLPAVQASLRD